MTLIEVMVVAIILLILLLATMMNAPKFVAKANDGRRKSDLEAFRIAFERYYEDNGCYPEEGLLTTCWANTLVPYLPYIMCDPQTKQPYRYVRESCKSFKLYTTLSDPSDPDIEKIGCTGGCGPDDNNDGTKDFNYGVSSGDANVGTPENATIPGLCILSRGKKCYAGLCGACCPGDQYRCDAQGLLCVPDALCSDGQ